MRCAVYGCNSNTNKKKAEENDVTSWGKIHYHSFPKDQRMCQKWVDQCSSPNTFNPKSSHVCSLHFEECDYTFNDFAASYGLPVSKKLKKDSVPSRNVFGTDCIATDNGSFESGSATVLKRNTMAGYFSLTMCRVCENKSNLIDIANPSNQSYVDQFLACANVTFEANDGMPHFLCEHCAVNLENFYAFKSLCEQTQKKFQDLLASDSANDCIKIEDEFSRQFEDDTIFQAEDDDIGVDSLCVKIEIMPDMHPPPEEPIFIDNDNNTTLFLCDICTVTPIKTKSQLEKHMQDKHGTTKNHHQCPHCRKWFQTAKRLFEHIKNHKILAECKLCDKRFSSNRNMARHIKNIHEGVKEFRCSLCDKPFSQKTSLQSHMLFLHSDERNHSCSTCGKSYKTKQLVKKHEICHLPPAERAQLKAQQKLNESSRICQYCGKILTTLILYHQHLRSHSDNRPYLCSTCGKAFKTRTHRDQHMNSVHLGERPHECEICDRKFGQKNQLTKHIRTHTGEKPYKCEYCDKTFTTKMNCQVHQRSHTGQKPYECRACDYCSGDLNGLKRHCKRMHPE